MNQSLDAARAPNHAEAGIDLPEVIEAVRRRALPMGIAFGTLFMIALMFAAFWPATYFASGTILIEQQEIPQDFVRSSVSGYADERVQVISQRVMTSANLLGIIEQFNLYAGDRDRMTREALVKRMRDDIKLEMISASVVDPRGGGAKKATIAFSVGFESDSPELAARVANELVSLYLKENLETRMQQVEGSTEFLTNEAEKVRLRVVELEQRLAEFKRQNYDRLPEFSASNQQAMAASAAELREIEFRIGSLDQRIDSIDTQLLQTDPHGQAITGSGERLMGPADRLRALRIELTNALSMYTPKHPTVISLQQEITALEQVLADEKANRGRETPDNPAYLQLAAQRREAVSEREALRTRRGQLQDGILRAQRSQAEMPAVEAQYGALLREVQGEQAKYAELREKQMTAQLSQNLESEQKGERFTLIEPPLQPQKPIRPNRPGLVALGLLLALAAAGGVVALLELLDNRVRGRREVVGLLGVPPLAVIPWITPPREDAQARRKGRLRFAVGAASGALAAILLVHILFRPLDVLWAALMRRLGV